MDNFPSSYGCCSKRIVLRLHTTQVKAKPRYEFNRDNIKLSLYSSRISWEWSFSFPTPCPHKAEITSEHGITCINCLYSDGGCVRELVTVLECTPNIGVLSCSFETAVFIRMRCFVDDRRVSIKAESWWVWGEVGSVFGCIRGGGCSTLGVLRIVAAQRLSRKSLIVSFF